jgi:hypothetical protein
LPTSHLTFYFYKSFLPTISWKWISYF